MHVASELPLLLFTLLSQMAVGILLVGQFAIIGQGNTPTSSRLRNQCFFALLFIGLAALLSVLHLGTPTHSPFTILHIGSSWLSREIFMVIATGVCVAGLAYTRWKMPDSRLNGILAILACLLGFLLIYAMSKVYNSPFMPGWAGNSTFFLFFASTLILGSLWQGCVAGSVKMDENSATKLIFWRIFLIALAGFVLMAIFIPLALPKPSLTMNINMASDNFSRVPLMQALHACLSGIGILTFCYALWQTMSKKPMGALLVIALLFAISGEIAGRMAFYMSYVRLGM